MAKKKKKKQQGGYLEGPSHKNGGMAAIIGGKEPVELEGGEYIIKKSSVDKIGKDNLARINKEGRIPTMAQGGMVGGHRHSQGGTLIEAEKGEFIMSREAVTNLGLENMRKINNLSIDLSGTDLEASKAFSNVTNLADDLVRMPDMAVGGNLITSATARIGRKAKRFEQGGLVMSHNAVNAVGIEGMNRINRGRGASNVNIVFESPLMTEEYTEEVIIPQIKESIRRGADIGIS